VYQIVTTECPDITKDIALQIVVKAINDTASLNRLVPTLLVFRAYLRMTDTDSTLTITERVLAIHKVMDEITKIRAENQVKEALRQRNGLNTSAIHNMPLNSNVLV
jgi:hypothetical protein